VTKLSRRLLWPATMTAAMLIVLLGLGTWQVQRLLWKQALLAQIERAEAAGPVPLAELSAVTPFIKVSVTGTFLPSETALYGADVRDAASGPTMGAQLIEPLREANGDLILVERGWVPLSRSGALDQPASVVTVLGYVRAGDTPGWFSAKDDPAARRFFTLNPAVIGSAIGHPNVRNFVLVALAAGPGSGAIVDRWPDPARHLPRPPNNHLAYAITWYGLAVALLAIFIVWARKESHA
jgi:surfeit locus 1 family protein